MSQQSDASSLSSPERSILTDAYGVDISVYTWVAAKPQAIVQIAHGIGEHALRYTAFAEQLQSSGFTVVAHDHRGHGQTGLTQWNGDYAQLGKLGPGGLRATEAVICAVSDRTRARFPNLPVIMFGHSWGSLMTQRIMNRRPDFFDAVILSGSAHRTPGHMESGNLNRAWRGSEANGFEWLSRDPQSQQDFIADPLCFEANIIKLFGIVDGLRLFGVPQRVAPSVPLLIVSGSDDPLNRGSGLRVLADTYRAKGVRDVTLRLYPGARHELLQETNRSEVIADLITWIWERFPSDDEQA